MADEQQPKDQEEKNSGNGEPSGEERKETPQKSETAVLIEKIAELEKQVTQYKDQLLRKAAEFDNYKRRTENDFASLTKYAGESIISHLLPVLDDITRSLKSAKEKGESDSFVKGIELIYAKFLKVLEAQGLKTMEVVGKPFDVGFHDALMQIPRPDLPPHTVVEEVEKGYLLFDKVIRHAKVVVSAEPVEAKTQEMKPTEDFED